MPFQTSLTPESFSAASRFDKIVTETGPVCFMLSMSHDLYILEKERIDESLKELDRMSAFARIEEASARVNELLPKKTFTEKFSLVLFQYTSSIIQVSAFPQIFLFRTPATAPIYQLNWRTAIPLLFPNTNRIFSEIAEVDTRTSRFLAFSFGKEWAPRGSRLEFHEGGRIKLQLEKEEAQFSRYVSKIKERMERTPDVKQARIRTTSDRSGMSGLLTRMIRGDLVKYGLALLFVSLAIAGINSAATNRFTKDEPDISVSAPMIAARPITPELYFDQAASVSSKYLHTVQGLLPFEQSLLTYQAGPNILLRISPEKEVSPILLDSDQIGNLTRGTRFGTDFLAFIQDKEGIVFLDPEERRWRLVEFKEPDIKEYTDLTSYEDFLYILDSRSRQIWKLTIAEGDLTGIAWAHDARVDLSRATHIAIDGSIYVALADGGIVKMNAGKKDSSFRVDPRVLPFGSIDTLSFVDKSGNLFVLDRGRERIVELAKSGDLVQQYVFPQGFVATDFFVNTTTAFILSANRVYQFPLLSPAPAP